MRIAVLLLLWTPLLGIAQPTPNCVSQAINQAASTIEATATSGGQFETSDGSKVDFTVLKTQKGLVSLFAQMSDSEGFPLDYLTLHVRVDEQCRADSVVKVH